MNTPSLPGPHNITRVVLNNGITLLVYENFAAQSVVLTGVVNAGAIYNSGAQAGLAAMTAGLLMRGTQHRSFQQVHETLETNAADLDYTVGAHKCNFYGKALAEDLPLLVDMLNDTLRYPTFPDEHVERLRGQVLTGLQYRQNDTRYRAGRAFREALYPPEHPYFHSIGGTLDTIPTLTRDHIADFHRRHYGPDGMVLVVVGAVRAAEAVDIVRARLENWHNPEQAPRLTLPALNGAPPGARLALTLPGKTQSDIVMGCIGPSRYADDYIPASLANSILGQFGLGGRIGDVVREELGLAYYVSSSIGGGHGPDPWSITAGVNPANVALAVDRIIEQLRMLVSEPVDDEELADNKSYFTGHLPLELENNEGLASIILRMESYGLGLDFLLGYHDRIYRLTKDDLLAAAQRYLNPDALVISVAGPALS